MKGLLLYPGSRSPPPLAVDECVSVWPGCRPTGTEVGCHGLCPWGSTQGMKRITKESIIEVTYSSENLPPAFAEAASRRQVAPLCPPGQRPYRPAAKEG